MLDELIDWSDGGIVVSKLGKSRVIYLWSRCGNSEAAGWKLAKVRSVAQCILRQDKKLLLPRLSSHGMQSSVIQDTV